MMDRSNKPEVWCDRTRPPGDPNRWIATRPRMGFTPFESRGHSTVVKAVRWAVREDEPFGATSSQGERE